MHEPEIEKIWPQWHIEGKPLGSGTYGTVYKIRREMEFGDDVYAALKVIHIPRSETEINLYRSQAMDEDSIRSIYRSEMENLSKEISVMESLKSANNIVSIEDFDKKEDSDGIGWTIYIRMELLTSLYDYQKENPFQIRDIVRLGCDICTALESCEMNHIIHRDIKPANIFVNKFGSFKLGDFGIARQLEKSSAAYSVAGTPAFEAPEVEKGDGYDHRADIYSLGLVLYVYLNHGRQPFLPRYPQQITVEDTSLAQIKKKTEKNMPLPDNADAKLGNIVVKACSLEPDKRYQTATDFKYALSQYSEPLKKEQNYSDIQVIEVETDEDDTGKTEQEADSTNADEEIIVQVPGNDLTEEDNDTDNSKETSIPPAAAGSDQRRKKSTKRLFLIVGMIIAIGGVCIIARFALRKNTTPISVSSESVEYSANINLGSDVILKGDTTDANFEYQGEKLSHGDGLKFTSSDTKIASVGYDSSVNQTLITGISEGNATITGTKGGIAGKKKIIVAEKVEDSNVKISDSIKKITLEEANETGTPLKFAVQGRLAGKILANVYPSKGLNIEITGGFQKNVLSITVRDMGSKKKNGFLRILLSKESESERVLAETKIPIEIEP